jgi:plasmid stabilization system protein ParE
LKLRWTQLALTDFEQAHDYVAHENQEPARQIAKRVLEATKRLLEFPRIGRIGEDEETREWLIPKTPYLIIYTVKEEAVEILRIWHMSRNRSASQR